MSGDPDVPVEEYKAGLENLAEYSTRRLTTSAIFVGFNTIALTGLGALIASGRFDTWKVAIEVALIALAISPVNILWVIALSQYKRGLNLRYAFLQRLESALFPSRDTENKGLMTTLHHVKKNGAYGHRHTSIEIALAIYFLILFLIAALATSLVTFYTLTGGLPFHR